MKYSWGKEFEVPLVVEIVCSRIAVMRCIIHAITLKQSFKRIIDLDVDDYKAKIK
jgi:hypothetical protein